MRIQVSCDAYNKFRKTEQFNRIDHSVVTKRQLSDGSFVVYYDLDKLVSYYGRRRVRISVEDLKSRFDRLRYMFVQSCGAKYTDLSDEDLKNFQIAVNEIRQRQQDSQCITLHSDLSLDAAYIDDNLMRLIEAWSLKKRGPRWSGKLINASAIPGDITRLQAAGYMIVTTESTRAALVKKLSDLSAKKATAWITPAKRAFSVELTRDNHKVFSAIKKHLTVPYKSKKGSSILSFAKEDPGEKDKNEKLKLVCPQFTLPAVLRVLNANRIRNVIGVPEQTKKAITPLRASFRCTSRQEAAYSAWAETKCGTIEMPTGGGKTMVGIKAIVEESCWTVVVVPTIELIDHWKKELLAHTSISEKDIGVYCGSKKEVRPVTLLTYQSGHRLVSDIDNQSFLREFRGLLKHCQLLILDEGHHGPAEFFSKIMMSIDAPMRMNLTATVKRDDGNESLAFLACGPRVYTAKYSELALSREVAPIQYQKIMVPLSAEETELVYWIAKLRGDYARESNRLRTQNASPGQQKEFNEKIRVAQEEIRSRYLKTPFGRSARDPDKVQLRKIFGYTDAKFEAALRILEKHAGSRTMVFNQLRLGAHLIHSRLQENGFRNEVLIGGEPEESRRRIFTDFVRGANNTIVTTTVLNEGVNVPDCQVAIIFNATSSKLEMIQRMGRTARYRPGKVSYIYELVSYVDHALYGVRDCERFSDYSMYEIDASQARNVSREMGFLDMAPMIDGHLAAEKVLGVA